jgi:hypothetical protein
MKKIDVARRTLEAYAVPVARITPLKNVYNTTFRVAATYFGFRTRDEPPWRSSSQNSSGSLLCARTWACMFLSR